jgi:hypothetical protein
MGKKVRVFSDHVNPFAKQPVTGTNDIWQARAMGYTNPGGKTFERGLSETEHAFMDAEGLLAAQRANDIGLGGRTNWTPEEIQAAVWVRINGESIAAKGRGKTLQDGIKIANETYGDLISRTARHGGKHTASVPQEVVTGGATNILGPLAKGTRHQRHIAQRPRRPGDASPADLVPETRTDVDWDKLSQHPDASMINPETGQDVIHETLGMYQAKGSPGVGYYKGTTGDQGNLNWASHPQVALEPTPYSGAGRTVADFDKEKMTSAEIMRGIVNGQEASTWNKVMPEGYPGVKAGGLNSLTIDVPGQGALRRDQIGGLNAIAEREGFEYPTGFWAQDGNRATMVNFDDPGIQPDWGLEGSVPGLDVRAAQQKTRRKAGAKLTKQRKFIQSELDAMTPEAGGGAVVGRARTESDYIDMSDDWAQPEGSGAVTRWLDKIPAGDIKRFDESVEFHERVINKLQVFIETAADEGRYLPPDWVTVMRMIGSPGGTSMALREAKFGSIPVPVLAGVFSALGMEHLLEGLNPDQRGEGEM